MKVIGTESSQVLAGRIADALKTEIVGVHVSRFPDGEIYLRTGRLADEMAIVGSVLDSDSFLELLLLIDACEGSHCRLVIPYMGYARQDKKFRDGEPVSSRVIACALSRGVDECLTVNIHDTAISSSFAVPARDISLASDTGSYIRELRLDDPFILAPDDGAAAFAEAVAETGGWDWSSLDKTRISGSEVQMAPQSLDVSGRAVVIVDDIISTGGTIATAASLLTQEGAREIYAACVHGVLAGGAYARLKSAGIKEVVCSDTIERGCSRFSAAQQISSALGKC